MDDWSLNLQCRFWVIISSQYRRLEKVVGVVHHFTLYSPHNSTHNSTIKNKRADKKQCSFVHLSHEKDLQSVYADLFILIIQTYLILNSVSNWRTGSISEWLGVIGLEQVWLSERLFLSLHHALSQKVTWAHHSHSVIYMIMFNLLTIPPKGLRLGWVCVCVYLLYELHTHGECRRPLTGCLRQGRTRLEGRTMSQISDYPSDRPRYILDLSSEGSLQREGCLHRRGSAWDQMRDLRQMRQR